MVQPPDKYDQKTQINTRGQPWTLYSLCTWLIKHSRKYRWDMHFSIWKTNTRTAIVYAFMFRTYIVPSTIRTLGKYRRNMHCTPRKTNSRTVIVYALMFRTCIPTHVHVFNSHTRSRKRKHYIWQFRKEVIFALQYRSSVTLIECMYQMQHVLPRSRSATVC